MKNAKDKIVLALTSDMEKYHHEYGIIIKLNQICHGLLPSGVQMRHALRVAECTLLAVLYNAMETLLAAAYWRIP
jgi:hypothetical protein